MKKRYLLFTICVSFVLQVNAMQREWEKAGESQITLDVEITTHRDPMMIIGTVLELYNDLFYPKAGNKNNGIGGAIKFAKSITELEKMKEKFNNRPYDSDQHLVRKIIGEVNYEIIKRKRKRSR